MQAVVSCRTRFLDLFNMIGTQKDGLTASLLCLFVLFIVTYFYFDSSPGGSISISGLKSTSSSRQTNVNPGMSGPEADKRKYTPDWLFQNPPGLTQNDSAIINYIRKYHLTPPSTRPYNLAHPNINPSEFWKELSPYLNLNGRTGFFIEAGANDGEYLSNTLHLEKNYNWKGLLVEPSPLMLAKLRLKNLDCGCWTILHDLSVEDINASIQYTQGMGMLKNSDANPYPHTNVSGLDAVLKPKDFLFFGYVECFPLFSILSALNVTEVDYMSLDIQGPELKVLKTIPFDFINIKVITVEFILDPEGVQAMTEFLKSKNYKVVKKLGYGMEILAVQKDYFQALKNIVV